MSLYNITLGKDINAYHQSSITVLADIHYPISLEALDKMPLMNLNE
jgi:hypothetical protein